MKKIKPKKCKACGELFTPFQTTQKACSVKCAMDIAKEKADKEYRKETRRLKEKTKTRSQWMKEAQQQCNKYIRLRDEKQPCISCGRYHQGQYHASHYRSVAACSTLRFHPMNIHKGCQPCNTHLSGNILEYRIRLIDKIGIENVEWLESQDKSYKWSIEEIKAVKEWYLELYKSLC